LRRDAKSIVSNIKNLSFSPDEKLIKFIKKSIQRRANSKKKKIKEDYLNKSIIERAHRRQLKGKRGLL
jgi:hypothetical protein